MEEVVGKKEDEVRAATAAVKETVKAGQNTLQELLVALQLSKAQEINDQVN